MSESSRSRRTFLALLLGGLAAGGSLLEACSTASPAAPPTAAAGLAAAPTPAAKPTAAAPAASTAQPTPPAAAAPVAKPTVSTSAGAGTPTGIAVVRYADDPDSLLAGVSGAARSSWIFSYTANGLVTLRQPDLAVDKDLAQDWSVSPDARTYTFTLHKNIKWHDGQDFSADDVAFTYHLFSHPAYPGPLPPDLAIIDGADAFKKGQATSISGIQVTAPDQISFTLTKPSSMFLAVSGIRKILPKHVLGNVSPADLAKDPFARKPIYTGPFMVDEWRTAESVTLKAFPQSFAGPPKLAEIILRPIPDPATALAALQSGDVQMSDVTPDQFDTFSGNPAYRTLKLAGLLGWYLQFDLNNPLFSDQRVRAAIGHAIDRKSVVDALLKGQAELSTGIVSSTSWIYDPSLPVLDFNPSTANALLDHAGWTTGSDGVRTRDGQRFEFSLMDIVRTNDWALAIQPMLKSVGISFAVDQVEFGTWITRMAQRQYQSTIGGWNNGLFDPRGDLQAHFQSGRATDSTGYANPQVDQLFQQAVTLTDQDQQKQVYQQIQQLVTADTVYVPLWRPQDLLVAHTQLTIPSVTTTPEMYARAPQWTI